MDTIRAAAILLCLTLFVTMGTGTSAPVSAQPTNVTVNSSATTEELGSGGAELNRTLHEEITHALDELEDETNLLNRVRRIVTKRSGGSYTCSMSCIPKTFEELKTQVTNARNDPSIALSGGSTTIRLWSVNVNLENGYSITTSFGAAPEVLEIMQSLQSQDDDCIKVTFDENKHRFPTYLLRAELKESCTHKNRYTCKTADNVMILRLSQSACDSNGKESWSPFLTKWRNCKFSATS